MKKKIFIEKKELENDKYNTNNQVNSFQITNDKLVNDFLNKNISLENLIENEIYNIKL